MDTLSLYHFCRDTCLRSHNKQVWPLGRTFIHVLFVSVENFKGIHTAKMILKTGRKFSVILGFVEFESNFKHLRHRSVSGTRMVSFRDTSHMKSISFIDLNKFK